MFQFLLPRHSSCVSLRLTATIGLPLKEAAQRNREFEAHARALPQSPIAHAYRRQLQNRSSRFSPPSLCGRCPLPLWPLPPGTSDTRFDTAWLRSSACCSVAPPAAKPIRICKATQDMRSGAASSVFEQLRNMRTRGSG